MVSILDKHESVSFRIADKGEKYENSQKYSLVGVTNTDPGGYGGNGDIVVFDDEKQEYRRIEYAHCSCNCTEDCYNEDETEFLCSRSGINDLIENDTDPRCPELNRKMNWDDVDALPLVLILKALAITDAKARAYLERE